MLKTEQVLSSKCPNCHTHFIVEAIGGEWDIICKLNLKLVLGIHKNATPENCDGIFLGDIIGHEMCCPKCGADPFITVEKEYADTKIGKF